MSCVQQGNVYDFRDVKAKMESYKTKATPGSTFIATDTLELFIFDSSINDWRAWDE